LTIVTTIAITKSTATAITPSYTARKVPAMNVLKIYNHLKTLNTTDLVEFLVSKVNVCDLQMLQGFADFDENSELAFQIYNVRVS